MAITKIRQVPRELPHAHLYLDDVEEICQILTDVYKKNSRSGQPEEPTLTFSTADRRMDSIEDLRELGGSATNFDIVVGDWGGSKVRFYSILRPTLEASSLSTEDLWAVYGRIKTIFDNRQYHIKNTILSIPSWLGLSMWLLLAIVVQNILPLPHGGHVRVAIATFVGYVIVTWAAVVLVMFRKSRVSFVRSHERSKLIEEAKQGYFKTIILLAVGAIIGGVITEVVKHYVSTLWK